MSLDNGPKAHAYDALLVNCKGYFPFATDREKRTRRTPLSTIAPIRVKSAAGVTAGHTPAFVSKLHSIHLIE